MERRDRIAAVIALAILTCGVLYAKAHAETLESIVTPPKVIDGKAVTANGSNSIAFTRVDYGSCGYGDTFGIWKGGKQYRGAARRFEFADVFYVRTCTKAIWTTKKGATRTSPVEVAEAP